MPSIVCTPLQFHLWSEAQSKDECASTKFWEHYIRGEYRPEDNWVIASQQPPTNEPGVRRRVELTVEHWDESLFMVFIWEAKKHKANQSEVDNLEHQAYEACLAHLSHTGRSHIYAMTTIGTMARLWIVHVDEDYPVPWVPGGVDMGDKSYYIDAHSTDGSKIVDGWDYMKNHKSMSEAKVRKLREVLHAAVESNQSSIKNDSPTPGPSSSPDYGMDSTAAIQEGPSNVSGFSYTLPILSTHGVADSNPVQSASGPRDTVFGQSPEGSSSGKEVSLSEGDESQPLIPESATYVELEIQTSLDSGDFYRWSIGKDHYKKACGDWKDGRVKYESEIFPCVFCVWTATGEYFYTWNLRDVKTYAKKGKKQRG